MTSMLATDVNYGVRFIFELGTCNPDKGITGTRGPLKNIPASFQK